ncbi:methyltransferase domain-containing protein [Candidatus Roizmanbacteria bacterium]|nr:methyltransferase domain-containing protein [Candidatus Roizmanbacteria bacterium]
MANWYDEYLTQNKNSYQRNLILPNLIRLLQIRKGEIILDLGCGQGFFSREFAKLGGKVIGVDISSKLIEIAKNYRSESIEYYTSSGDKLNFLKTGTVDKIVIILTIQNIENAESVIGECSRVLKPNGRIFIVLNHPAFRVPKKSSWGFDDVKKIQYRRLDSYLSESKEQISMHPGKKPWEKTASFHRPLQFYFKILDNKGFCISRLEEWISPKKSEEGPRKNAEDTARREFPLFLYLQCIKHQH